MKVPCYCIGLKVYSISWIGVPRSSTLTLFLACLILVVAVLTTFFSFLGGDYSNYLSTVFCIPATFSFEEAVCWVGLLGLPLVIMSVLWDS